MNKISIIIPAFNEEKNIGSVILDAKSYGDVIVGLLTDEAIASYKNIPHLDFKRRKIILQNIKFVKKSKKFN